MAEEAIKPGENERAYLDDDLKEVAVYSA